MKSKHTHRVSSGIFRDLWDIVRNPRESLVSALEIPRNADRWFIMGFGVLLLLGLVWLTSASGALGEQRFGNSYYFLFQQLLGGLIPGVILALFAWRIPTERWRSLAVPLMLVAIVLLVAVFIPGVGLNLKGASRWINFGFFAFQPAEIAKFAVVVYLARWLTSRDRSTSDVGENILPFFIFLGILAALLMAQPDLGTLSVIAIIAIGMYWIGGGKTSHVLGMIALGLVGIVVLSYVTPYRMARIKVFMDPSADTQNIGYHLAQAKTAISHGGIWGQGLGNSTQKYLRLPEVAGDSVFAIIAEEGGFIFCIAYVLFLFLWLGRGWYLAMELPDQFNRLLASGLLLWIGYQTFINIAAISGVAPLTGVPLPFVSFGGTAYAMNIMAVSLLLSLYSGGFAPVVSRRSRFNNAV